MDCVWGRDASAHTSIILSTVISGASYIVGVKQPDSEKVSVYECGFDPFESSRIPFSVRFFLVGILFTSRHRHVLPTATDSIIHPYNETLQKIDFNKQNTKGKKKGTNGLQKRLPYRGIVMCEWATFACPGFRALRENKKNTHT